MSMSGGVAQYHTFSSTYVPMPIFVTGPTRPAAESRNICDTHPKGRFQASSLPARMSGRNSGLSPYLRRHTAGLFRVDHYPAPSLAKMQCYDGMRLRKFA